MDRNYWRPAYEFYAFLAWTAAAAMAGWGMYRDGTAAGPFLLVVVVSTLVGVVRLSSALRVWSHRICLTGKGVQWIDGDELQRKMDARPDHVWLGWGFAWRRIHMQRVYDLEKVEVTKLQMPWPLRRRGSPKKGNPLLHGVEPQERDIYVSMEDMSGHVFVPATTGAIKTRLLALLAAQAIRRRPREAIIVIDPKGGDLHEALRAECIAAGREDDFAYFHPAFPGHSVRIDVLRNWTRSTEVASRVASLIPSVSGNDPFSAFGWRVINLITDGLINGMNERPTLMKIRHYLEGGVDHLVGSTIERLMERLGLDCEESLNVHRAKARRSGAGDPHTLSLVSYYKHELQPRMADPVVDGLVSMFEHNREHFDKMVASLIPVLTMLTAGDLADLLSPDRNDDHDTRPILDGLKIVDSACVVYVGLDSLSDTVVGDAIGSIFLADLAAVAGARYNAGVSEPRINLFIDEANQVVNPPLIQLLNKGRAAGVSACFFSQTVPDFIARLGNEAMARQVLGNANNVVAGRTKDKLTSEYATETFGRSVLRSVSLRQATGAVGDNVDPGGFSGAYGEGITETLSEIVPPEALGSLPDLEYFASVSGNRIVKGRIPLLRT